MSPSESTRSMLDRFRSFGNAEAIIFQEVIWTYTDFISKIEFLSADFLARGINPGDVVILKTADYSLEAIASLWALCSTGVIVIPLTRNQWRQSLNCQETVSTKWICDVSDSSGTMKIEPIENFHPVQEQAEVKLEIIRKRGHAGLVLLTSGTTALPRLVLHDLSRLLGRFHRKREPTRILAFLMFDHMGGIDTMMHALSSGGTLILPGPGDRSPESIALLIDQQRIQLLPTSPTFLNYLLHSELTTQYSLKSLERISFGTESMPELTLKRLRETLPWVKLTQSYGTTEVGVPSVRSCVDNPGWMQLQLDNSKIKIVDGELFLRTENAMIGYLNAPDPFDADGWYATGDLVEYDSSQQFFRILGRKSDIINVGGEKASAMAVEDVIRQADNIRNVLVRAESNPLIGQMIAADVELMKPEKTLELSRRLRDFCKDHLESYQIPSKFQIVEKLQLTDNGKIKRQHEI